MEISCVDILGIQESIVASGLPMKCKYDKREFKEETIDVDCILNGCNHLVIHDDLPNSSIQRAKRLSSMQSGESHDCFLCGIIAQMNITAPRYWWPEFQRYHFADIVSSTSTMHRLKNFIEKCLELENENKFTEREKLIHEHFDDSTHPDVINSFIKISESFISRQGFQNWIKPNLPEGWLQTARITTNYRQLKTMYRQRKNHILSEWKQFCGMIERFPMSFLFTGKENDI